MKPIAKLILVAMLLFWARQAQATTLAYCSSTYSSCMSQCYVPWEQATEYCPHTGVIDTFCWTYYAPTTEYKGDVNAAEQDECAGGFDNSCLESAHGNLLSCTASCASQYCTIQ